MAEIIVVQKELSPQVVCEVVVKENGSQTKHCVTVPEAYFQLLTNGKMSEIKCVETAFKFLLDHEPKESIMASFDLTVIEQYFPDFKSKFIQYR